jgi:hypothetical protein
MLCILPIDSAAEVPALTDLQQTRYVVRPYRPTPSSAPRSALWSWNPETGESVRLRPLVSGTDGTGAGAFLAATGDRLVLQGSTYVEIEAATSRILRRYAALPPEYDGWAFRGILLTADDAATMGLEPGYYGFPSCTPGFFQILSLASSETTCRPVVFPGDHTPRTTAVRSDLLYRRPAGAAAGELTIAAVLPPVTAHDPLQGTRHLTLDRSRSRLWFQHRVSTSSTTASHRFGYLPLAGGVGAETVLAVEEQVSSKRPRWIFFDPFSDTILTRWDPDTGMPYLMRRPADLSAAGVVVETGWLLPEAMATLAPELPQRYEQVVPAIGRGPGAFGTYWRSDVWLFNPSAEATSFTIRRVSGPGSVELDLPAHGSLEIADVLGMLGGGPQGDGVVTDALVVDAPYRWGEQLTVYSRTYTTTPEGDGTYGQAVPAVPGREGYATQLPKSFTSRAEFVAENVWGLAMGERDFRHNLGVVNDSTEPLEVEVWDYWRRQDRMLHSFVVAPRSVANVNLDTVIRERIAEPGFVIVQVTTDRPAPIWLSVVDNRSGDASFLPFMLFNPYGADDAKFAIPAVTKTPGANGSYWRSDLDYVYHPYARPDEWGRGEFYPADPSKCGGTARVVTQFGADVVPLPDVVSRIPECTGSGVSGALELSVGSWMSGYVRTYTTREDGGTYGDILPFYPTGGWPVQHFSGLRITGAFRVNLGLYNGMEREVVHRLLVYDRNGTEVARRELTLAPRQSLQAPLAQLTGELAEGLYGLTVLPLDEPGSPGRSWAYVSVVDNVTNDPTNLW